MYFYGVAFADARTQRFFDLARLILEPDYARKVHITLRGPYQKRPLSRSKWLKTQLGSVWLTRPDCFFSDQQSTVFLRAESIFFNEVFYKPDYPESVPHLTLYDGKDRRFAWQILLKLREFPWKLRLELGDVAIIERKHDYSQNFFLSIDQLDQAFADIAEKSLTVAYMKKIPIGQRIHLLERICARLHSFTHPSSAPK